MKKVFPVACSWVLAFLFSQENKAQGFTWSTDSMTRTDPDYNMHRYHEVLRFHDPLMYLVFPIVKSVVDRKLPLQQGEGTDGFWLEGHLGYRFAIYKGKFYSPRLLQRTRFTLDVGLHSMLTRDESSPILPFNNKIGLGLDFLLSSVKKLRNEEGGLVWTTFQVHHYSNGQADSFFLDVPVKRNNYKSGNFSTNYWRTTLNIASNKHNLLITSLGFQREVDPGGALGNSTELENYYGDGRVLVQVNWIKKPDVVVRNYMNRGQNGGKTVEKQQRRQLGVRTELEYITGNLSAFPGTKKHRAGWHTYITYMPSVANEVGFILHTYLGRHYLNIRFDDIVFAAGLGLYVKFN